MRPDLAVEYVAHHLRLFGVDAAAVKNLTQQPPGICMLVEAAASQLPTAQAFATAGGVVIAIRPRSDFSQGLGIHLCELADEPPILLHSTVQTGSRRTRLRTLHRASAYRCEGAECIVSSKDGDSVWLWLGAGRGGFFIVGTDLPEDLVRYRQGDPAMESRGSNGQTWGSEFERPLHLFEGQIEGEPPHERHADSWATTLAEVTATKASLTLAPLLPGGAPGAIVITGDDDQASLERYDEQIALLADAPITYFLHPKTRHTRRTLKRMQRRARVDLGIHPDALDAPDRYGALLREQVEWFRQLVQAAPVALRNHGFLSSGYWRHLPHWVAENISISSNIPGLDGRVLNGSLLPARIVYEGALTSHWSLLTAIGDGVVFIQDKQGERAADCVRELVQHIKDSRLPGVVVLNLHPQNVNSTRSMHLSAMEAISGGFQAWTLRECLEWFQHRDGSLPAPAVPTIRAGAWQRITGWLR